MVTGSNCSNCSHNTYKTHLLFIIIDRVDWRGGGWGGLGLWIKVFFLMKGVGLYVVYNNPSVNRNALLDIYD